MIAVGCLLAGCQAPPPATPSPSVSTSSTPTPSATPTSTPFALDFTLPGAAEVMLNRLLADAGSRQTVMAEVTATTVTVAVLKPDEVKPVTWAYRDGEEKQVANDLEYVDQAVFDIGDFDVSDVGKLFAKAAELSGSTANQSLHIVDYSGGRVVMAVTTNPESRTVFFEPDGSLLPELDFHTLSGISQGLDVVTATRTTVQALGVDSATGAWVDYPATQEGTVRRQRTAKVPVTTTTRDETLTLAPFQVNQVSAAAIWDVVRAALQSGELKTGEDWSVTVDDRAGRGVPRMHFTFGLVTRVTDLAGHEVTAD